MQISVAIIGLGFGEPFVPIYQLHPKVDRVGICEVNPKLLMEVGDRYQVQDRFGSIDEVLADPKWDAVHILTPVPLHVEQTLKTLDAGKHCACAVPIATALDDIQAIIGAEERSGKNYMMMETGVYTREFLFAQDMHRRGEFGNLTFLRGAYYQDLEGPYPRYWYAQPPMHYSTHVVGPILALAETRITQVSCLGAS